MIGWEEFGGVKVGWSEFERVKVSSDVDFMMSSRFTKNTSIVSNPFCTSPAKGKLSHCRGRGVVTRTHKMNGMQFVIKSGMILHEGKSCPSPQGTAQLLRDENLNRNLRS